MKSKMKSRIDQAAAAAGSLPTGGPTVATIIYKCGRCPDVNSLGLPASVSTVFCLPDNQRDKLTLDQMRDLETRGFCIKLS